jgi:hypothetical protein
MFYACGGIGRWSRELLDTCFGFFSKKYNLGLDVLEAIGDALRASPTAPNSYSQNHGLAKNNKIRSPIVP